MLACGKSSCADILGIVGDGPRSRLAELRIPLDEFGAEGAKKTEHVVDDQNLTVAFRRGSDADCRYVEAGGYLERQRFRDLFGRVEELVA